mgnify:CR=1 FL=1
MEININLDKILSFGGIDKKLAKNSFTIKERLFFYEELVIGIEDGVAMLDIVDDVFEGYKRRGSILSVMAKEWSVDMKSGRTFANALSSWVPESELYLIASGEEKNNLAFTINELIYTVKEQEELSKSIKKKLLPQVLVIFVFFLIVYGGSKYISPGFKELIPEKSWPEISRNYFLMSDWAVNYVPYIGTLLLISFISIFATFKSFTGSFRNILDDYFPWSVYKKIQAASFLIVLSGMIKSGIATRQSIEKLYKFSSPYMKTHFTKMNFRLSKGIQEGSALDTGLFDKTTVVKIENFGKRSGFSKGILSIGKRVAKETRENLDSLADKIGKYVTYLIFGYVGFSIVALSSLVSAMIDSSMF